MESVMSSAHDVPPRHPKLATRISHYGIHPIKIEAEHLDIEAIRAKYESERMKRLRPDGVAQFIAPKGAYSHFTDDVVTSTTPREPVSANTKVLIVGAGFAGMITAVRLKKDHGIDDFVMVDRAGGFGGTWYWNQYPGVACDVESYIYIPFLEETGYIPKDRFSYGPEIREHMERVSSKWHLEKHAILHTKVTSMSWDKSTCRWHVRTNRSDNFIAQFVVLATGTFHEPKLPGINGIQNFKRPHFHSSRWDYSVTGGGPDDWNLTKLAGKTVGVVGTGASAAQLIPQLARSVGNLYVFQRTPSSVTFRENFKTAKNPSSHVRCFSQQAGWQQARMEEFADILQGTVIDRDNSAVEGLEVLTVRALFKQAGQAGISIKPEEVPELLGLADLVHMEKLRNVIKNIVHDEETAEKLKPWYSFMCKRPVFHNDYLDAFNRPNVQLVDTDGKGVSHLTPTSVVANGQEYEVDLLVYSTGFDLDHNESFYRRTGINLVGTRGKTPDETWEELGGPLTLFGIHWPEFPNLFNIGPSQSGLSANWTHTAYVAGEHIADVIARILQNDDGDFQAIEPTEAAAEEWAKQSEKGSEMRMVFSKACTPGHYNKEGKPEDIPSRAAPYPKGIMEWKSVMKKWREQESFEGMEKH
ncbi:FAD/NAD(P)-binding domain-containing protein [Daldinia bambusicola]|nr:FAD/NAD(P)-binding domain-containing protein [Daldinia bambusicola]